MEHADFKWKWLPGIDPALEAELQAHGSFQGGRREAGKTQSGPCQLFQHWPSPLLPRAGGGRELSQWDLRRYAPCLGKFHHSPCCLLQQHLHTCHE